MLSSLWRFSRACFFTDNFHGFFHGGFSVVFPQWLFLRSPSQGASSVHSFACTMSMDSFAGLFSMPFIAARIFMGLSPGAFSVRFFAVAFSVHFFETPFFLAPLQGFCCMNFRRAFDVGFSPGHLPCSVSQWRFLCALS